MTSSGRAAVARNEVIADGQTVARMLTNDQPPEGVQIEFLVDVLAAAPDHALDFVTGQVEAHTARGGDVARLVAALRPQARAHGKHAIAAVTFIAARGAEGTGDSEQASDLIDQVLDLRPDLAPAHRDAGEYAAARGNYLAADDHLRRARSPHPLQPGLKEILVAAEAGTTARNQPCPCGSGRKYKMCCRRNAVPPLSARAQLLYALLGNYAERAPGLEIALPLTERTANPPHYATFCLDLTLFPGGMVDRFLAARGHWLRPDERDLIDGWRTVPVTLYETLEVRRGTGLTLRALPDGEPVHVTDRLFSTCAEPLKLFCGRLLDNGTAPQVLALPVVVPRDRRDALLDLLATDPAPEQIASFFGPPTRGTPKT